MKATGDGLRARMTGIAFDHSGLFDRSGLLVHYPGRAGIAACVVDLTADTRHRAVVTVLTSSLMDVEERLIRPPLR
jgi:hypothetical protein